MKKFPYFIFSVFFYLLSIVCNAEIANADRLSARDAQSLPLKDLASRVLGQVGSIIIDVERPEWGEEPDDYFNTKKIEKWPPSEPPPLHLLRFFGKAVVTGSQFGMCGSDWITVYFNAQGSIESVNSERRYGVADSLYRPFEYWSYKKSGEVCNAVKNTRNYFPAPDASAAETIALYIDAASGRGAFSKMQNFKYECEGSCEKKQIMLEKLNTEELDKAMHISCVKSSLKYPSCFELVFGKGKTGPYPKTVRIYGTDYMNRIVVESVKIFVGSTVE